MTAVIARMRGVYRFRRLIYTIRNYQGKGVEFLGVTKTSQEEGNG